MVSHSNTTNTADVEKLGDSRPQAQLALVGVVVDNASPTATVCVAEAAKDPDLIVVDWLPGDPEHPFNWSKPRKWTMVCAACLVTALSAVNATSMGIMATWGPAFYHTSREGFVLGLTLFNVAVSMTPLVLAPISEGWGRNEIYQVTGVLIALLFIPQSLSHSHAGYLAARWFQGMVSSVGISMVGGTISDLYVARDRGQVMNFFALVVFVSQACGGLTMGWVGMLVDFRWCYGSQGIAAGVSCVINAIFLRETRSDTLLRRRAKRLTKETGIPHVARCDLDQPKASLWQRLQVTAIRPLKFLFTEPIVSFISLWIGFAWAVVFLGGTATILVFRQYGFNDGEAGSIQACIAIGGILGYVTNYHQEHLYRKAAAKSPSGHAPPEARLYWAAVGGLAFPVGQMAFAWTGRPPIPWPVPALMLVISYWGIFSMYVATFNYLADAYETYSSSAQAAQGFARNTSSGIFPLFAYQMYKAMGYPYASTLVAAVGFVLAAAPFLLIVYGARLRARSPVTSSLVGNI